MIERFTGLLGIVLLLALAWALSTERAAVRWRTIGVAMALQLAIALLVLRTPFGASFFEAVNQGALAFLGYADRGIDFVFGRWPAELLGRNGEPVHLPFVFAIRVLPILIFLGSVFSVLYHVGLLQRVIALLAHGLRRVLRISGAESLATVANIFLGMVESPLLVRPYVEGMTRSELFCVMTAGFATVAGSMLVAYIEVLGPSFAGHLVAASFMSAPAAVAVAKLLVPETSRPLTLGDVHIPRERTAVNVIDAAATGAMDGLQLALNVGAMLIAFVAMVYGLNDLLSWAGGLFGFPGLSFERILGWGLAPVAFLLGIPTVDAVQVGQMLGVKTILNEFLAYQMLADAQAVLQPRSAIIASYALCGFANLGSLAILLGGLGGIAPSRRGDIARDGMRAILAGSIATFMTGAMAGLVL